MKKWLSLALCFLFCLGLPVTAVTYDDLAGFEWAQENIYKMTEKGILEGVGNNKFDPAGDVTNEQLAKMAVLAFELELKTPETPTFTDVEKDRWSYSYVETAKDYFDMSQKQFLPEQPTPRWTVAKVIAMAALKGQTIAPADISFTDQEQMTPEMKEWVGIAVAIGLVEGYEDGSFRPLETVNRAETAAIVSRGMEAKIPAPTPSIAPTATPAVTPAPTATATPNATPEPTATPELKTRMDFFVVDKVVQVERDGVETMEVTGFDGGDEITFSCERAKIVNSTGLSEGITIQTGDVLSAVRDITGDVRNISILFSASAVYDGQYAVNPNKDGRVNRNSNANMLFSYGMVRRISGNSLMMVYDNTVSAPTDANTVATALNADTVYYEYNPDTKKIKLSDKSAITMDKNVSGQPYTEDGCYVFTRSSDLLVSDVLIVPNKR